MPVRLRQQISHINLADAMSAFGSATRRRERLHLGAKLPSWGWINKMTAVANKAAVYLANRALRNLPFVHLTFFRRSRLLLLIRSSSANVLNVVGCGLSGLAVKPAKADIVGNYKLRLVGTVVKKSVATACSTESFEKYTVIECVTHRDPRLVRQTVAQRQKRCGGRAA